MNDFRRRTALAVSLAIGCVGIAAAAPSDTPSARGVSSSTDTLPDSPGATQDRAAATGVSPQIAKTYARVIQPDQRAQPLSGSQKVGYAVHETFNLDAIVSPAISAGISHLENSSPHFGTDRAGYGERYGKSSYTRAVSQLTRDGVFAPLFHDDPRFYVLGRQSSFSHRIIYAGTRAVITRRDDGRSTVNLPEIFGTAVAQSTLVPLYPQRDQTAGVVLSGFGSSIGIDAALDVFYEFKQDIFSHLHHK